MQWYDYDINPDNKYVTSFQGVGTDTPHYAYDVETPFHTPLNAILPGTVVKADYAPWGGEIFIKPDNTSYPEYYFYHPDLIEVNTGDHVNAGQEIALSGGELAGYPGALHPSSSAFSTGPHTHVGWFSGYITPSETGETIPYGPDPVNLIAAAKGNASASSNLNLLSSSSSSGSSGDCDITKLGPVGYIQCLWNNATSSVGNTANGVVNSASQAATTTILSFLSTTIGPFLLRLGIGGIGIASIVIGLKEIANALDLDSSPGAGAAGKKQPGAAGKSAGTPGAGAAGKKQPGAAGKSAGTPGAAGKKQPGAGTAGKSAAVAEEAML